MNVTIIYNIIDFYLISFYYYFTNRIVFRKRVYINYYSLLIFVICGVMFCLGKIMPDYYTFFFSGIYL